MNPVNSIIRLLALGLIISNTTEAASYDPAWASITPKRTVAHQALAGATPEQNGAMLVQATGALQPGDRLEIGAGTYSVERLWDLRVSGTAEALIWIVAAKDAQVVLTRPDKKQNVLNVSQDGPVCFLCLRGLEFTGGSHERGGSNLAIGNGPPEFGPQKTRNAMLGARRKHYLYIRQNENQLLRKHEDPMKNRFGVADTDPSTAKCRLELELGR